MLKNKFNRHTTAFLTVVLASILVYPLAQDGLTRFTWMFLGLVVLAAVLTLTTK